MRVLTPWVSVIIPARNAGPWIADALSSLLDQSEGDWEAIVVNDASTDDTEEKARAFGAGDPRIRTISGAFGGAAAARNAGIAAASGCYVLFLDADDWLSADFLARTRRRIDNDKDVDAAYGSYQRVATSGALCKQSFNSLIAERPLDVFARECGIAIHAIVLRRTRVTEVGGFDVTLKTCEDWDLWQRLARHGVRFIADRDALVFYRMRDGSLSSNLDQLLSDAQIVRARGFSTDFNSGGTIASAAEKAITADLGAEADWAAYLSVWCAAAEIGAGRGDGLRFLQDAEMCEILAARRQEAAGSIVDGLIVGAAMTADELAAQWRKYRAHLAGLADALEARSGSEGCAQALLYAIEFRLLDELQANVPVSLNLTASRTFEVGEPSAFVVPSEVDTVELVLRARGKEIGRTVAPVAGGMSKEQAHRLLVEIAGLERYLKLLGRPKRLAALALAAAADPRGLAGRVQHLRGNGFSTVSALRRSVRGAYAERGGHRKEGLASTNDDAELAILSSAAIDERSSEFWEELFETPDPWNYRSQYEREKYEFTLSLIPSHGVRSALEIACAEGIFTESLAKRVEHLKAVDISERALQRARQLCAQSPNVTFDRFDLSADEIAGDQDLIVCSEVLYFLKDEAELAAFALRVRDALAVGGRFVTAHAFVLIDDKTRTAFDWNNPFGAAKIHDVFASIPGLRLDKAIVTELYRVDAFIRVDDQNKASSPDITYTEIKAPIERDVARYIVRGGVSELRGRLRASVNTTALPVLMYHRVASDGPAALARYRTCPTEFARQIEYLRKNGYYTPTSNELVECWRVRRPLPGRPVFITFDDGYADFQHTAWDVLYAFDMSAHVFLVTDKVGGVSDWDSRFGEPATLMDWKDCEMLARDGVSFGSHLATHRRADGLSSQELIDELTRSRKAIELHTGAAPRLVAPPFGLFDKRFQHFAREAGYDLAFSTHEGVSEIGKGAFSIPRLEPVGGLTLEDFAAMLGRAA